MTRYLRNMDKEININNNLEQIGRVALFIEELGASLQLPPDITMSIDLAIEEAITNIIRHAYPEGEFGEITLRVHVSEGILTFVIIDDGISFDPTNQELADETLSLEQQLTEGLGLVLIRHTMDEVIYHTIGAQNYLTLIKRNDMSLKPETTMKINLCKIDNVTILTIEGRLDTVNANEFSRIIQPLLNDMPSQIIINCEGMTYISSSGLRYFIILQKSAKQRNTQLIIEAMKPEIRNIFDMTGCSSFFTIR